MSHSYNKIWIHAIWATKERTQLIHENIEKKIHDNLYKEFTDCSCRVRIINGMPDHIHSLFLLNPRKAITDVIKQVKGATSHWANDQNVIAEKFAWQTEYAAYSVSESQLEKVFQYIKNQKAHHRKHSFDAEFDAFTKAHGFTED